MVVLVATVVVMNLNVLRNEFLAWDDALLLTENPRVQISALGGLLRVLSPADALAGRTLEYLPLRDAFYAILFHWVGLVPWPYRVVQILFHAGVCVLVFACARAWVGERAGFVAGAFFAVHPVHVEAVAWLSALKEPTFCGAILGSLLLYTKYLRDESRRRWRLYAGALVLAAVALGFKQIAVALPPLVALVGWAFGGRSIRKALLDAAPFFVVAVAAMPLFLVIGSRNHVLVPPPGGTRFTGALTMTMVFAEYLLKMAAPFGLSARYVIHPVMSPLDVRFVASAAAIAAAFAAAIRVRRRTLVPLFTLGWFTVAIMPVMNIIPIPIEMADRYLYLPSVGIAIGAGAGVAALLERPSRVVSLGAAIGMGVVVVTFLVLSVMQNEVWENDVTLWTGVVRRAPEFYIGRTNLAYGYLKRGDLPNAERELRAAIQTKPTYSPAYVNLGMLLRREGRSDEALAVLETAVRVGAENPKAHNDLAAVLMDQSRWAEAKVELLRAIALSPEYATAHRNLALVCMNTSDVPCAIDHMQRAMAARPADRGLFLEWLKMLRVGKRADLAPAWRGRIDQHFSRDAEIWRRYAELCRAAGDEAEADAASARAAELGGGGE